MRFVIKGILDSGVLIALPRRGGPTGRGGSITHQGACITPSNIINDKTIIFLD